MDSADPLVIAGQGTIGLEIIEDLPDVDAAIVPVGGGSLISGIAAAMNEENSRAAVVGAEPEASPGAYQSLAIKENWYHDRRKTDHCCAAE